MGLLEFVRMSKDPTTKSVVYEDSVAARLDLRDDLTAGPLTSLVRGSPERPGALLTFGRRPASRQGRGCVREMVHVSKVVEHPGRNRASALSLPWAQPSAAELRSDDLGRFLGEEWVEVEPGIFERTSPAARAGEPLVALDSDT